MRSLEWSSPPGDRAAAFSLAEFTEFYRKAFPSVYSYLANRCGSAAQAEDLLQDCFAAAVRAAKDGVEPALSLPWVMRVARNKLVDHYRRETVRRLRLPVLAREIPDELVAWNGEATRDKAQECLAAMSANQRAVLVLRHMDGLSVPEIAEVIGRSVHATESLLARARVEFKRHFVEVNDGR